MKPGDLIFAGSSRRVQVVQRVLPSGKIELYGGKVVPAAACRLLTVQERASAERREQDRAVRTQKKVRRLVQDLDRELRGLTGTGLPSEFFGG